MGKLFISVPLGLYKTFFTIDELLSHNSEKFNNGYF
jgi:hypothetical protein